MAFDYKSWKDLQHSAANDPSKSTGSGECPTVIFLIGTVWSALGSLLLLMAVLDYVDSGSASRLPGLIAFGWMHLFCGLRTLTGTADGTTRNGIVALVFGLIWALVAVMGAGPAMTSPTAHKYAPLMVLGIAVTGFALLLTGVLALVYSETYQRWRDPYGRQARATAPGRRADPFAGFRREAAGATGSGRGWIFAALVFGLVAGAVLFTKPRAPSDAGTPGATIEDFGRYTFKGRTQAATNRKASGGVDVNREEDVTLVEQTDQLPRRVGETWGVRLRWSDVPTNRAYTVRQEMYHPPIRQPDGSVLTKSVREVKVRAGGSPERFCGWHFLKGYEYELVAGEWVLVVFIDDTEVARKSFRVRE